MHAAIASTLAVSLVASACNGNDAGQPTPETSDDTPGIPADSPGPADDSSQPLRERTDGVAAVTTVATDYSVGALAVVDPETWATDDRITTLSSDPVVMADSGWVFVLNRYGFDTVQVFEPGALTSPVTEFSVGDRANPQAAAICGGGLFVTLHSRDYLPIYDPETGWMTGKIDLSAFDDGDGSPEAATMVRKADTLYVALEQFDQANNWMPAGGRVIEVGCAQRTVLRAWEVGNAPTVHPYPGRDDQIIIRTGVFFSETGGLALDGAIRLFDLETGTLSAPLVDEQSLEANLGPVVATETGKAVFISSDASWQYTIHCLDLNTGEHEPVQTTELYLAAMTGNDKGEAWIAARPGPADPGAGGGILVYDVDRCNNLTADGPIPLSMPPYSVTFY